MFLYFIYFKACPSCPFDIGTTHERIIISGLNHGLKPAAIVVKSPQGLAF